MSQKAKHERARATHSAARARAVSTRVGLLQDPASTTPGTGLAKAPRAAEEMAREEQRAHVRQMRWAREHGRGEPVRCFDAEEYDEGDDAFDALFDGGSGYGWDSSSGGGAFF